MAPLNRAHFTVRSDISFQIDRWRNTLHTKHFKRNGKHLLHDQREGSLSRTVYMIDEQVRRYNL